MIIVFSPFYKLFKKVNSLQCAAVNEHNLMGALPAYKAGLNKTIQKKLKNMVIYMSFDSISYKESREVYIFKAAEGQDGMKQVKQ